MQPLSRTLLSLAPLCLSLCLMAAPAAAAKPGHAPKTTVPVQVRHGRLTVPAPDLAKLAAEDRRRAEKNGVPLRYGEIHRARTDLANDAGAGRWTQTDSGAAVLELELAAPGARTLELGFTDFHLPHGARLEVLAADDPDPLLVLGDADNPPGGILNTAMLLSDRVILRLTVAQARREFLSLVLDHVTRGYRDPFAAASAKSGSCNVDATCPEGEAWSEQIATVAGYRFADDDKALYCSGNLMNTGNRTEDLARPRFSTAQHCVSSAAQAASMVLYWGYESPSCRALGSVQNGTPLLPPANHSRAVQTGGARLLVADEDTDFAIVELNTPVPAAAMAWYSGWDRSGSTPRATLGIHHPAGHEKRITFNDKPASIMHNCTQKFPTAADTHWKVSGYELGTTEGGSSGSGLWSQDHGLLIGVLSGGNAGCAVPDGYDCYGRLSAAWQVPAGPGGTSVREALDRSGTNPLTMPGQGSCDAPEVSLSSTAFDQPPSAGSYFELAASASGGAGGYRFLWDVDGDGIVEQQGPDRVRVAFPGRHAGNVRVLVRDAENCLGSVSRALEVRAAQIEVVAVEAPVQVCGNDDGRIDPGEQYRLPLTLKNTGDAPLGAGALALFAPAGSLIGTGNDNRYGYEVGAQCDYGFVDIATGPWAVDALGTYVANGNDFGPYDDARTTEIALGGSGFALYGSRYPSAVMSTNGYVSLDPEESGGDWDWQSCGGELLYGAKGPQLRPYHDDLVVRQEGDAGLRYRYFDACPRPAASGIAQGCHVFQWNGMGYWVSRTQVEGNFAFQAIGYEDTGEVAYQYQSAAYDEGDYANIGLVAVGGGDPLILACESFQQPARAGTAWCIHSPEALDALTPALRLSAPTLALPDIPAGASRQLQLPFSVHADAACGAPLAVEHVATAAADASSPGSGRIDIAPVDAACAPAPACDHAVAPIRLQEGAYFNPARPGNGYDYFSYGGFWYTAEADQTPTWYAVTGEYTDNLLDTPLLRVTNESGSTQALAPRYDRVGRLRVARLGDGRAMMAWRFKDGSAGAEFLQLATAGLPRAEPDHTQAWYAPVESGWGVTVESVRFGARQENIALAYLYDLLGQPRWLLSSGTRADGALNMETYRPHCPGCPHFANWQDATQAAGLLRMQWPQAHAVDVDAAIQLPAPLQGEWQREGLRMLPVVLEEP